MGDFGGGIRAYFWRNAFIRPEVRLYLINNNVEFSSSYATRYSISLGYSLVDASCCPPLSPLICRHFNLQISFLHHAIGKGSPAAAVAAEVARAP